MQRSFLVINGKQHLTEKVSILKASSDPSIRTHIIVFFFLNLLLHVLPWKPSYDSSLVEEVNPQVSPPMGTGWRRAFCTTIPRETELENQSPRSGKKPSTPRLKCRTVAEAAAQAIADETPRLHCKTKSSSAASSAAATPKSTKSTRSPFFASLSNPSSPRSPLKLSLFKNSFKFRSNSCGVCSSSVKTSQGTAIYTAECGHVFHFPCITDHVRNRRALVCPVCNSTWKDVPLLAVHKDLHVDNPQPDVEATKNVEEDKKVTFEASLKAVTKQETKSPKLVVSRSYDDDEPLLSPTAGAKFVPIPEADESAEEEDPNGGSELEEFQGFFVNRNQFSDEVPVDNFRQPRQVEVKLLPETAVVSVGRSHETYAVVVRVKAPPPPVGRSGTVAPAANPPHRAPIDLVTVLDVSGSMTGAKLQMLKRAMRLVIASLGSSDRLSIVAFTAAPKRLLPLKRMTAQGQQSAQRIVDRLVCGQGASVSEALRKAAKVLEDRRERNTVASIMLLSDGHDERVNSGHQNHRQPSGHASSTRFSHIEVPVHSSGFGKKRGYSHEPAEDAFAKCVSGLLSVVVRDLRIQLDVSSGSAPAEITAIYPLNGRPMVVGAGAIRLGDLYAEEEKEYLVELKVPASTAGARHVISVRCCYKDPATQEIVYCRDRSLLIPRPHAVRSSSPKIERLRNLFVTTRAVAESRRLVDHGDFTSAHQMLASARTLLVQLCGLESAEEYIRALEAELAELYWRRQSGQERERLAQRGMDRMGDEYGEPLTPTSAWRAAEQLAKVAMMKKSMNKVSDLHGFENARF